MAGKLFGRAVIRADGNTIETNKGASLDLGGVKRTAQQGARTIAGYTEETTQAKLECEMMVGVGVSVAAIGGIVDATITFECDTGQTYIMNHAWSAEPPQLTEGDGKAKLVFEGPPAVEMM